MTFIHGDHIVHSPVADLPLPLCFCRQDRPIFDELDSIRKVIASAGILYASRVDSDQPAVGEGWLMGVITAAILGGTSLKGGQGTILGHGFRNIVDGCCLQWPFASQRFRLLGTRGCRGDRPGRRPDGPLAAPGMK
jgi:hypothetical protein